jgi:hypothetical protein
LALALFFSFGHASNLLPGSDERVLAGAWLAAFLALAFQIMRFRQAHRLTLPLNVLTLVVLVISLIPMAQVLIWRSRAAAGEGDTRSLLASLRAEAQAEQGATPPASPPDIYFLVLDSYERADALLRYYGFDNRPFIRALESRGFYVASQSRSNYLATVYSLSATLNLVYIHDLPHEAFTSAISGLRHNHVADFLQAYGYQTVHFPSGFGITDDVNPDVWAAPAGQPVEPAAAQSPASPFELLVLDTTLARLLIHSPSGEYDLTGTEATAAINKDFDQRRDRLEYAFSHLPDYAQDSHSSFVFAHMILPHNPYLYDASGTPIAYNGREFLLGDKTNSQNNIGLYTDQLQYTNARVLEVIDRILQNATVPPIIIIQADHGHDTFFEFESPTPQGVDLRSAILYGVYFPGGEYRSLYPSITPVNTFRVTFNQFFGTDYPLLPDRTFLHPRVKSNPALSVRQFVPIDAYLDQLPSP